MSKLHRGLNSGNVNRAFKEMEKLYVRESPFNGVTEGAYAIH
jgi:hypothetical protein